MSTSLHASSAPAADIETWFVARGGWIFVSMCALVLAWAWWVWHTTPEPPVDETERTCPPVDLDTELRKLLEDEGRRS
jgi:hypothetical protein